MSASVNRVTLIGNLGGDPILRYTSNGTAVCNFSLATSRKWQDKEETTWHTITVWGKQAENCGKSLAKGKRAYVEGRINNRQWEKSDGTPVKENEIIAELVLFLSPLDKVEGRVGSEDYDGPTPKGFDGAPAIDSLDIPF